MMDLARLHRSIDASFDEHLGAIQAFLRQVSIGATGEGMAETAALCGTAIERAGGTVELASFGRYPIVYGQLQVGAPRTLLVWSKYDVMPVDEPGWVVPPSVTGRILAHASLAVERWTPKAPCRPWVAASCSPRASPQPRAPQPTVRVRLVLFPSSCGISLGTTSTARVAPRL